MWLVWETISQDGRRWSKRGTDAANEFKSIQGIKRDSDRLSDSDEEAYVPEKLTGCDRYEEAGDPWQWCLC